MPVTFYLFLLQYILVFAQARVLHTQGNQMESKRITQLSIISILGWISFTSLLVYFGIEYSWSYTIISFIITAVLSGIIIVLFPFVFLICRFWPFLLAILLYLEFLK
jgi:hypothetical protein